MTFRKILFWLHLVAGVVAGTVILVMCVTGTLLTFQQSVLRFIERDTASASCNTAARCGTSRRRHAAGAGAARRSGCRAGDGDARFGPEGGGVSGGWGSGNAVRRSLQWPGARHRLGAGTRVLSLGHQLAPLAGRGGRRPDDRARHNRGIAMQLFSSLLSPGSICGCPGNGAGATSRRCYSVPPWSSRQTARLQLANAAGLWCAPVLVVLTATGMVILYPGPRISVVYARPGARARRRRRVVVAGQAEAVKSPRVSVPAAEDVAATSRR